MSALADEGAEPSLSQTVRALLALREAVLEGALQPGERISEPSMAKRIGLSRTPIRAALMRLEEEGLLDALPTGGYAVRAFTEGDILDAIEIRGVLEGTGARLAAERGASPELLAQARACLAEIDALMAEDRLPGDGFQDYVPLNARFHALLLDLAQSPTLARQMERATAIPFASPSAFVMAQSQLSEARTILTLAQEQHRAVIEAIEHREGARAESLMREHAKLAIRNLRLALENRRALGLVKGASLIRLRPPDS
ncbi:GntR family transcriptional regulator [Aureimonas ureilytica]|uniref:GntR family transcriptional regulator n=1 Tax=Aureimonas ureilytica TaxID=401562 RepID=A0A175RR58_9HYPH|nr:GntR family transcriptional regulator [Aureimonas ureilytica]KTR06295.1 GntR family transcriptional regulator [Aureimonas ureilytica]